MAQYKMYNPYYGELSGWQNNDNWSGEVDRNGYATGYGIVASAGFNGTMKRGIPTGKVSVSYDEIRFKGMLKNGLPNGKGTLYKMYSSSWKKVYEGNWKNGLPDGRGKHYNTSKSKSSYVDFNGTWVKGIATRGYLLDYPKSSGLTFIGDVVIEINSSDNFGLGYVNPDFSAYGDGKMYKHNKLVSNGYFEHWKLVEGKSYWPNGKLKFSGKVKGYATLYWESGKVKFKGKVNNNYIPLKGKYYNSKGELVHEGGKPSWYKFKKRKSFKHKWKFGRRMSY